MKVVIIGQGYVGLPISMAAVNVGFDVVGLDLDAERIARLTKGRSFVEDVSSSQVQGALESGRFLPTTDYDECDGFKVAVITVPTPLRETLPDLSFIESAARSLAPFVTRDCLVVLESTTYPGTTDELLVPILEAGSGLKAGLDFHVGYSPERIDPGNPTWSFENTPKVISGLTDQCRQRVKSFYEAMVETTVPVKSCKEAELTKLLENTFRHVNIALVNELAVFAQQLGIDVWDAIDAAATKPFGFMKFTPGPGVGGHCLPIDPSYLSWRVRQTLGRPFRFIELANDVNEHMPDYVVSRVGLLLNASKRSISGSTVLAVGLTYKKNSSDARESPAVRVVELLTELGAQVTVLEPFLESLPRNLTGEAILTSQLDDSQEFDLGIVLTDHESIDYGQVLKSSKVVLDTRRRLEADSKVVLL